MTAASGSRSWRTSARSAAEQPAARMTYSDIIAGHRDLPGPAVRTGDGSCTWPELLGRATSAVRWLAEIGAGAREPVAALVTTSLDVIALTLAGAAAGKPLAPLGPRLTERELVPCVLGIECQGARGRGRSTPRSGSGSRPRPARGWPCCPSFP